jgi:hypothetical protein
MSQILAGKGTSAMDYSTYSPVLAVSKTQNNVEDIKSLVKQILTFLFRILKTVLNNGQSAGNIVKNWREITFKNSRLSISASLKIHF